MHILCANGVDMQAICAEQALLEGDFARDVRVVLGADGRIVSAIGGATAEPNDIRVGAPLPAPVNNGVDYFEAGGRFGIGSDSNIRITLSEEIRTLEYSQRLKEQQRAALATETQSTARRLYADALAGGAQGAGRRSGAIEQGQWADPLALDATIIDLEGRWGDALLDSFMFAGDDRMLTDVWSAGRPLVAERRHVRHARITARYRQTIARLRTLL